MSSLIVPCDWRMTTLEICVDILDSQRVPVNNKERRTRIQDKSPDQLYPYFGATGEVGKIDGYLFDEELVALGEDGVPFLDPKKTKAYVLSGKTWVNNHAHVLRSSEGATTNRFLLHYLNQFDYQGYVNGGTRLKLTQANMRRMPLPFPPLAEQEAIAEKLDTLLAQVESTEARLERIPKILKRFRQSVLAAAVSGKLTEEWRERQGKARKWEPRRLGDIIDAGPQNGIYKPSKLYGSGCLIIRIDSFYDGVVSAWGDLKRVRLSDSEIEKWKVGEGDILVNRVNSIEYLGKSALVRNLSESTVFESNVMRMSIDKDRAFPEFVSLFLRSPVGLERLRENAKLAVNQASINQGDVKKCAIELPDLTEQTEIVRRVDQLFAYADTIETQVNNALERVNNLTQSILAKAFRGELTEQWRKDNPDLISGENSAEALLGRISAQRIKSAGRAARRGKGRET